MYMFFIADNVNHLHKKEKKEKEKKVYEKGQKAVIVWPIDLLIFFYFYFFTINAESASKIHE